MFYVISYDYPEPKGADDADRNRVVVSSRPARANSTGEPVVLGWAGTSDDVTVTAHGAYATIELAAAYAETEVLAGDRRPDDGPKTYPEALISYRCGSGEPLSAQDTRDWCSRNVDGIRLTDDMTLDEQMAELVFYSRDEGLRLDEEAARTFLIRRSEDAVAKAEAELEN